MGILFQKLNFKSAFTKIKKSLLPFFVVVVVVVVVVASFPMLCSHPILINVLTFILIAH
jgi:hypothetical protein